MLKKMISKKYIIIAVLILLIPFVVPIFNTLLDILLNLGRVFGTIARQAANGIFCKSL